MIDSDEKHDDSTTSLRADVSMDIWGFGVTMYNLCTEKYSLFRYKLSDDTLFDETEKDRLLNWEGPTEKDLNKLLPYCKDSTVKENAIDFFRTMLHKDKSERFQTMNEVLNHAFFAGSNTTNDQIMEKLNKMDDKMDNEMERIH